MRYLESTPQITPHSNFGGNKGKIKRQFETQTNHPRAKRAVLGITRNPIYYKVINRINWNKLPKSRSCATFWGQL